LSGHYHEALSLTVIPGSSLCWKGYFWALSYSSADLSFAGQWGPTIACRKWGVWETTTKLCLSHGEKDKLTVPFIRCRQGMCFFCIAPTASSASKALWGTSTQQNYMTGAFVTYWKSSTAWRNCCSLLHQWECNLH